MEYFFLTSGLVYLAHRKKLINVTKLPILCNIHIMKPNFIKE